ncbi:MAG: hypothetical protein K2G03_01145, partial [Bacilli bacterium]|nr:hypothetical protein [Bacilli bacterium]
IAPFFEKLKYVCLILFICFFLIYDWIYKVKEKIDTINGIIEDDSKKFMMRMWTLGVTLQMMIVFLMTVLFVFLMVTSGNLLTIAFLSFFLFNGLATFLKTLAKLFNNHDIVSSYEKKHEKFVRFLLVFIAFISMVIGIGNENYLFAFGGVVICIMGFLILKYNKKEEEKKHR